VSVSWVASSLLSAAAATGGAFIDKYLVVKEVKDYRAMPIYGAITGFIMGLIFWIAAGFPVLALKDALILLLIGAMTIWTAIIYFKAMSLEEASKLILFFQMVPIFIMTLSFIFLKEKISLVQFLGFSLILFSVIGVSDNFSKKGFQFSKAFWLIMLADLMWSISAILMKFVVNKNSFAEVLSYESWGLGLGGIVLYLFFPLVRKAFNESIRTVRKKALVIIFSNEVLFVFAKALRFFAYSIGITALVSAVGSTEVFMGIFIGIILTIFAPHILKEDISKRTLLKKGALSLVMFAGLILVSL